MADSPAFQMYAADIYCDTNEWSAEAFGIYNRLLFHQWINGSIPSDHKTLAQISFISVKKFSKRWPEMSKKFVFNQDGRGVNLKLEKVRQKQRQYAETQKEKARRRWNKDDAPAYATAQAPAVDRGMPGHMPSTCSSTSSSTSTTKDKIKEQRAREAQPVDNSDHEEPKAAPPDKRPDLKEMAEVLDKICVKYPRQSYRQEVELFIRGNIARGHRKAMIAVMQSLLNNPEPVAKPSEWLNNALWGNKLQGGENAKYTAADADARCQEHKRGGLEGFGAIMKGMARASP